MSKDIARTESRITHIPVEILLHILNFLEIPDVIALRKTCTYADQVTRDKVLWLSFLCDQSHHLPLPSPHLNPHDAHSLPALDVERLVRSADHINRTWLLPRQGLTSPYSGSRYNSSDYCADDPSSTYRSVSAMDVFLDRWLMCIYGEGVVELWDLQSGSITRELSDGAARSPHPSAVICLRQTLRGDSMCLSSIIGLSEDRQSLMLMIVFHSECTFWRVELPTASDAAHIDRIATITVSAPAGILFVRALHPPSKLALLSLADALYLMNWETHQQWRVEVTRAAEEELWNGMIGARFLTPQHILCVKVRTVELITLTALDCSCSANRGAPHSAPAPPHAHAHVVTHSFPGTTFRNASFSIPVLTATNDASPNDGPSPTRVSIAFLASDVLRGLFHYHVEVVLPCAPLPPHMSVRLLAAHYMAVRAAPPDRVPRSQFTQGSRAFVSACVLGRTGRRGVWVERRRGSVCRGVVGFDAAASEWDEGSEDGAEVGGGEEQRDSEAEDSEAEQPYWWETGAARWIDGRTIFEVRSYDLRDDITHCALAEATGRIVLCTRNGEIQLL